jgi:PBP1b-binding outer membrane lipoprotein LpoB
MRKGVSLLWGALFLAGCIAVSTGEKTTTGTPATTTLGQQLQDLKSEYDRGLISQQEYNQRRERLLGN